MSKDEPKICGICKFGIDESKEFARVTHFKNKTEILTEIFYHINCYRERLLGAGYQAKVAARAMDILNKVQERVV